MRSAASWRAALSFSSSHRAAISLGLTSACRSESVGVAPDAAAAEDDADADAVSDADACGSSTSGRSPTS